MAVHRIIADSGCTNLPECPCKPVYLADEYAEHGGLYVHQPEKYVADLAVCYELMKRKERNGLEG